MSIDAMSACWGDGFPVHAEGLSPCAVRVVALAIADVVNDMHGYTFYASRKKVALKVGMDPDTIGDVLSHLVHCGVLTILKKSTGRPTVYRWNVETYGGSPHPLRSATATPAVTSPHHKTKTYGTETGRRDYDCEPMTPEEIAIKYGVEI